MADFLANTAMTNQQSTTSSIDWTPIDTQLCHMISADTSFPTTPVTHHPQVDLLSTTAILLQHQQSLLDVWQRRPP
jgi:hypothetical protein